jgi:tetratricopeptide (TPR) repeat protein
MAELDGGLDDALSGRGRIVMLAGEPGIGKTRLAQELASRAESMGAQVLWGWCYEREGAPSYWPWVQPLRSYVFNTAASKLDDEMGPGASDIAEVVPEIRRKLTGLGPPPVLEPAQARFRLFDSVTTFLKNASANQALMLVLDDLHWADAPSLLLLEFVARQIEDSRLLVVGAYRDVDVFPGHPLVDSLAQFSRNPAFLRLNLGRLNSADVAQFIQAAGRLEVSQSSIDAIHALTDGNPLFIREVIRLLEGRGEPATGVLKIPQGVLEVIGERLNRLSSECVGVLTAAAVIGREFDFKALEIVNPDVTEIRMLQLVEEALDAHIFQESPTGRNRYQFSHALVQQTLLNRLSSTRRVRVHAQVGEALEALYGDNPGDHAAELAHHFFEAAPVSGPEKLVRYSQLAGEQSLAVYAYEDAMEHFARGLAANGVDVGGSEAAPDHATAAMLFGTGQAQAATSRYALSRITDALRNFKRAFDYYRKTGQLEYAFQVAEFPIRPGPGYQFGLNSLVEPALELAAPDSPERTRLLSIYGRVIGFEEGRYDQAERAFDQALVIAERLGDAALEMSILADAANVQFFHSRYQEALRSSLRSIGFAHSVDDPRSELAARYIATLSLATIGNPDGATDQAEALLPLADKIRDHVWLIIANWMNDFTAGAKGEWDDARRFSDMALEVGAIGPCLSTRVLLEYESGRYTEGKQYLEQLRTLAKSSPPWPLFEYAAVANRIPLVARITGEAVWFEEAEAAAETIISSSTATPVFTFTAQIGLAFMAVIKSDQTASQKLYDQIVPMKGIHFLGTSVDRVLGLLAQTIGDTDQAMIDFKDALAFCRRAAYRPEVAWTCHDYADLLLRQPNLEEPTSGDRAAHKDLADGGLLAELLDEGMALATELGMPPLINRFVALQESAAVRPQPGPAYPNGLTQREVEVLSRIAGGKTNREIAKDLVLSVRTVERH